MQILFTISFGLLLGTSLFIGNALAGDYQPYAAFFAALIYLLGLFLPFISEYNVLHRGFTKMSDNFKTLMRIEERVQGDIEIITPGKRRSHGEQYDLDKTVRNSRSMAVILIIASALFSFDLFNFYILGDGLNSFDLGINGLSM